MSENTEKLRTLIELFNSGASIEIARYFTPDFELDAPADGARRSGYEGARQMVEALSKLGVRLEILHMIEQDDHVAVRYRLHVSGPEPTTLSSIAIYRFEEGRIAEDWGLTSSKPWTR
jgi:predicted SnoaL-like aldol condensation-catalyzing enzyme